MALRSISNFLDKGTGLPSKSAFLEKHVIPVKDGDKYNNDKCACCWDGYTEEHPSVKILPCGHVFGRDCVRDMIEGPTGDLCALCKVKIFRRDLTIGAVVLTLLSILGQAILTYCDSVKLSDAYIRKKIDAQPPWLKLPLHFILLAPQYFANGFARRCTYVCHRNPRLKVTDGFVTSNLRCFLYVGAIFAPLHASVYFIFGLTAFKSLLLFGDVVVSGAYQYGTWTGRMTTQFDNPTDRVVLARTILAVFLFKELVVVLVLWPAISTPVIQPVWTILGAVAWR